MKNTVFLTLIITICLLLSVSCTKGSDTDSTIESSVSESTDPETADNSDTPDSTDNESETDEIRVTESETTGVNFSSPKVTVYIPEGKYTSLSVKTSTGTVNIPNNFSFESIDISGNTGSITCNASAADNIKIKNSTEA